MYFNLKLFRECLVFIEAAAKDYIECSIETTKLNDETAADLIDTVNVLSAVERLKQIAYDDYDDNEQSLTPNNKED